MSNDVFISIDCNNTGRIIESYLLSNDVSGLRSFNLKLNSIIDNISNRVLELGGIIYLSGGDNILAMINSDFISPIKMLVEEYTEERIQFSIGIGMDAVSAYLALKYAKSVKACTPVFYKKGIFFIEKY